MTCCLPSGMTRVSVSRAISTRITEPSGMATGPSGNLRPVVISLCGVVMVVLSPLLLALEFGLALGEEGSDALAEVLGAPAFALEVALDIELLAEVFLRCAVHGVLDARQRLGRTIGQPLRQLGRGRHQRRVLDNVPDQAPLL